MDGKMMSPSLEARRAEEIEMLEATALTKELKASEPPKITEKEVRKATKILQQYKDGKARLEQKIIKNEEFWKLRQWRYFDDGKENDFKPASAWLWSCIQSRYSDAMDSYPTCNFQPRQKDDKAEAMKLSSVVPVIMEQNRYEDVYSDSVWYALKNGGCVQHVGWDQSKHNGLGDIGITNVDFINLFWEPGITDIQKSQNLFHTELVDNNILEQRYPQCRGRLGGGGGVTLAKYLYDDKVDTSKKSVVIDWYYHTEYNGKRVLQFVKYVKDIVLYATENMTSRPEKIVIDPETQIPLTVPMGQSMAEKGLYDHALYPFVTMALYPVEGSICGYGLTDIGLDVQIQIDKINKAITDNAIVSATPRYFIKSDGAVNEEEFADFSKPFVHVGGQLGEENIRDISLTALSPIYVNFMDNKVNELKYVTSNQDANNGVAPSGVTAASAIAALQETAGKNARSTNKTFYRMYREVCYQVLELIRQFYDMPRTFRIAPDAVTGEQFITYDNSGIKAQPMQVSGISTGLRLPEFDIEISAEKESPYKKIEINELALQFYNLGFFNPQMADQAIECLKMMDFKNKDDVIASIAKNGTMQQMLLHFEQLALQLASKYEPQTAEQIGQIIMGMNGQPIPEAQDADLDIKEPGTEEAKIVSDARERSRESTMVQ